MANQEDDFRKLILSAIVMIAMSVSFVSCRETAEKAKDVTEQVGVAMDDTAGSGFTLEGGKPIMTNKASIIEKLRGCVTIMADPTTINREKVLYFQFLGPDMGVIEDNANTITVNGTVYSKRVELVFMGEETQICDYITVPEESLNAGNYTLNVFEDEQLLSSTEFSLE